MDVTLAMREERNRIAAKLTGGGGDVERAAGNYYFLRSQSYVNYKDCQGAGCAAAAEERFNSENAQAIGRLVGMASSTTAPDIYFWALSACSAEAVRYDTGNACATLSRQKLVSLDQANGWAWLAMAAEANGKGNSSGVDNALFEAANSKNWTTPSTRLASLLAAQIEQASDPLIILGLLNDVRSISSEMTLSGLNTISSLCPANADQNRMQVCQNLARIVLGSTTDLVGLSVGLRVGERAGLPVSELADRREEYKKLQSLRPAAPMVGASGVYAGCKSSVSVISFLENSLLRGEISTLRAYSEGT